MAAVPFNLLFHLRVRVLVTVWPGVATSSGSSICGRGAEQGRQHLGAVAGRWRRGRLGALRPLPLVMGQDMAMTSSGVGAV